MIWLPFQFVKEVILILTLTNDAENIDAVGKELKEALSASVREAADNVQSACESATNAASGLAENLHSACDSAVDSASLAAADLRDAVVALAPSATLLEEFSSKGAAGRQAGHDTLHLRDAQDSPMRRPK